MGATRTRETVQGKVVFITGAARGVGAEVARRLHGRGAKLLLTDLDAAPLQELADELGGDRVLAEVADVRDLAALERAVANAVERFGGVDVVMANAGIGSFGSVLNVDPEAFRRVIDVDVTGVFHTVRAALPSIIERRGYVLVVSSLAAFVAAPGMASYDTAKAGVEHFANALRLEVAPHGVAVGVAHMSWIDTPLVQEAKSDLSAFGEMLSRLPGPLKNTATVEECGGAFVKGIERRSRGVYFPGWVRLGRWLRPVLASPLGEREVIRRTAELVPRMDAQAAALGRSLSARTQALESE